MSKALCTIGIDEAGRGPLAGPVAVGFAYAPNAFDWSVLSGLNDSKKVTEKRREAIVQQVRSDDVCKELVTHVIMKSAKEIDERGIAVVIREAIEEGLAHMVNLVGSPCADIVVKLDGGLKAPAHYVQETIIKGDAKEPSIMLASIMAKVARDEYMQGIAQRFPAYSFSRHKGYGTALHCAEIRANGLSPEHRTSFCKNIA